jgi:hypothetical protein
MKIDKEALWNILEKYDCVEYKDLCDSLSNIIQGKSSGDDLLTIYVSLEKIEREDRDSIEKEIGNEITGVLFSI